MKRASLIVSVVLLVFSTGSVFAQNHSAPQATIHIRDYCDPATFDAAVGPGACVRDTALGLITFPGFIAELQADKSVGAWRFAPNQLKIAEGTVLHVENLGGETHTFTEVKRFGGGIVPVLNTLSGNPVVAPECLEQPGPDNIFIPAGQSATVQEHQGVARYQCCIHPWMRLTITPKDEHHTTVQ
jgi:plastocyanin